MRYAGFTILLFHTMWFPMVSHGFPYYLMANPYKSHIIFRMFQLLPVTVASSETWKKRGGQSFWTSGFVQ
jgi:hypothetical protein